MSEVQKPVEEPVVAPTTTETPAVEESKATETPAVAEPMSTETAAATEAPKEETPAVAAPVKEEVKPVEDGVLGYKGPGLLKSFIFQKKFFWFGTEPVETKHLSNYLRGEKTDSTANHNAAWASHTGEGLLFFSKKASEKSSPAGVLNLSDVSDITEDGTVDFSFKTGEHKHTFQAASLPERDNWISVLKTKSAAAKEQKESVTGSETYKNSHSTLSKPVMAATALPNKSSEVKKEEKVEAKEDKKEDKIVAKEEKKEEKKEIKDEKKEEKKARKSRSASRKRNSIFGSIGFGKKEEKAEAKEDTPVAAPAGEEVAPTSEAAPVETAPVTTEAAAPVVAEEAKTEEPKTETEAPRPAPATKRNSIFGSLKSPFSQQKEKKAATETAPAVPAKDAEPVAESAPVIPAVETTEPLATSVASPATVPTETTTAPVTNGETKAAETPVVKNDKRKSSIPWLGKKDKATTSDEEGEKPKSPFARIRGTLKSKTSPKAEKAPEKSVETPASEPAAEETPATTEAAPTTTEPVVSEPIPAAHNSTPEVTASA